MLGIRDRFPQRRKRNLAVPLRAALNTTYGRCLKQGGDTKHVPSKDKAQKYLSSYQLFITETKCQRGFFDCPSSPRGGHGRDTGPWDRRCAAWSTRSQHICSDSHPGLCGFWKKSDYCGNLSLKFNILLFVRMQFFWEIQSRPLKQPCRNSETNSSAPVHPSQQAWSPQSPVVLSPDQVHSPLESCSGSYLEMHPSRTVSPTAFTCG